MDYFYFSLFTNTLTQIFLKSHSVHADRMAFLIKIDSSREYLDPAGKGKAIPHPNFANRKPTNMKYFFEQLQIDKAEIAVTLLIASIIMLFIIFV